MPKGRFEVLTPRLTRRRNDRSEAVAVAKQKIQKTDTRVRRMVSGPWIQPVMVRLRIASPSMKFVWFAECDIQCKPGRW